MPEQGGAPSGAGLGQVLADLPSRFGQEFVREFGAVRLHDAVEAVHAKGRHTQGNPRLAVLERDRQLLEEVATVRQARGAVEIGQRSHRVFSSAQAGEVLQRDKDRVCVSRAGGLDEFRFLVDIKILAGGRSQAVFRAEPAVLGGAGDEGLSRLDLLGGVEHRDERFVPFHGLRVAFEDLGHHRRHVQGLAVEREFPMADPRNALGQQQLGATRPEIVLHGAVAQQESHPLNQQARVHALLGEVTRSRGKGVADRHDVIAAGQHQDRQEPTVGALADSTTDFDTGHFRHIHVENHAVGLRGLELPYCLFAVVGGMHYESRAAEGSLGEQQVRGVVVRDQDCVDVHRIHACEISMRTEHSVWSIQVTSRCCAWSGP